MSAWPTSIDTLGNLRTTDIGSVGFEAPSVYDYHITTASPAQNSAYPAGMSGSGYPLVAWDEYVHPMGRTVRCQHALLARSPLGHVTVCPLNHVRNTIVAVQDLAPGTYHLRAWTREGPIQRVWIKR